VDVWTAQQCTLPSACGCGMCMCFANSCLCATCSWVEAVIQCVGWQCGAAAVTTAVGIAYSGCLSDGYGFPVPTAQLVSIGLAAISSSSNIVVSSPQIATILQSTSKFLIISRLIITVSDCPTSKQLQPSMRLLPLPKQPQSWEAQLPPYHIPPQQLANPHLSRLVPRLDSGLVLL
jgi:hypothetical protein